MEEKKAGLPAVIAPKAKDIPRLSLWDEIGRAHV